MRLGACSDLGWETRGLWLVWVVVWFGATRGTHLRVHDSRKTSLTILEGAFKTVLVLVDLCSAAGNDGVWCGCGSLQEPNGGNLRCQL